MDETEGQQEGRETQELPSEGMVDMSILTNTEVDTGEEEAGRDYDSNNSVMPRGSQNTTMYARRIYGFDGAVSKLAHQKKSKSPGEPTSEGTSGPAHGGDTTMDEAGTEIGLPLPPPIGGRAAGAEGE